MNGTESIFDSIPKTLKWPEYCVFAAVLVASMGIGIFYGFFDKKNKTNEEFLMAGRSMSVFPVTLSLVCSFVSAITLLGNPVEVYFYGVIYIWFAASFLPLTLAVAYLYLPVFWRLQLTSAYEYFEMRYNQRTRRVISVCAIVHLMIYMPLVVWGPSLALDQVAGINKYISSAVIFIVCIIYSSIGGLKAVLWSDALQAIIMLGSTVTVIAVGISEVGGFGVVWERAQNAGRTDFFNFDPDPRTRHTIWTGLIAAYFSWIPLFGATQAQIQRYLSVPTQAKARMCLWLNLIGLFVVVFLCSLAGLVIFARYYDCDPVKFDSKMAPDQLLPLFVMDVMGSYDGIPGLFVGGLVCGSLSSISSALNALPAIIVEDFVKPYRPGLTDIQLGNLSKIISAGCGIVSFGLIFVIAAAGDILPFASLLHGTLLGPIVGVYSLGMFFPWSNALGSMLGVIPSLIITIFIGVGSIVAGNAHNLPNQKLPLSQEGCYLNETSRNLFYQPPILKTTPAWKELEYSGLSNFLGVSYLWHPLITVVTTILCGLLFSVILNQFQKSKPVKVKYLTPLVLKFWIKVLGKKRLVGWVDFTEDDELVLENNNDAVKKLENTSPYTNGHIYGSIENIQGYKKSFS